MQVQRVLKWPTLTRTHATTPVIFGGDFNDVWGGIGRKLLEPEGFHSALGRVNTFPAILPVRALDRIFYRGELKVLSGFASRTAVARRASDHLPIVAEFEIE